jgi:hypothetical protein
MPPFPQPNAARTIAPHPNVIVTDGRETGYTFTGPGESAFRAGVAMTNSLYASACLVADAFALACTRPYLTRALGTVYPMGWRSLVDQMVEGMKMNIKWVVTGAGIGAAFGLGLGLLMPVAEPGTVAAGASLGAAIATYALVAAGVVALGGAVVSLSPVVADLVFRGFQEALAGRTEAGAQAFSKAIALVFGAIVPMILLFALTKGAGRLVNSRMGASMVAKTGAYMVANLKNRVAASYISTAAMAEQVGLTAPEWQAIAQSSRNMIQVFRGCNPNRIAALERAGGFDHVHFKPAYFNAFKSAKTGPNAGEYVIEAAEFDR